MFKNTKRKLLKKLSLPQTVRQVLHDYNIYEEEEKEDSEDDEALVYENALKKCMKARQDQIRPIYFDPNDFLISDTSDSTLELARCASPLVHSTLKPLQDCSTPIDSIISGNSFNLSYLSKSKTLNASNQSAKRLSRHSNSSTKRYLTSSKSSSSSKAGSFVNSLLGSLAPKVNPAPVITISKPPEKAKRSRIPIAIASSTPAVRPPPDELFAKVASNTILTAYSCDTSNTVIPDASLRSYSDKNVSDSLSNTNTPQKSTQFVAQEGDADISSDYDDVIDSSKGISAKKFYNSTKLNKSISIMDRNKFTHLASKNKSSLLDDRITSTHLACLNKSSRSSDLNKSKRSNDLNKSTRSIDSNKSIRSTNLNKSSRSANLSKSKRSTDLNKSTRSTRLNKSPHSTDHNISTHSITLNNSPSPTDLIKSANLTDLCTSISSTNNNLIESDVLNKTPFLANMNNKSTISPQLDKINESVHSVDVNSSTKSDDLNFTTRSGFLNKTNRSTFLNKSNRSVLLNKSTLMDALNKSINITEDTSNKSAKSSISDLAQKSLIESAVKSHPSYVLDSSVPSPPSSPGSPYASPPMTPRSLSSCCSPNRSRNITKSSTRNLFLANPKSRGSISSSTSQAFTPSSNSNIDSNSEEEVKNQVTSITRKKRKRDSPNLKSQEPRRSQRTKMKPVEFWRGELPIYKLEPDGTRIIVGVTKGASPDFRKRTVIRRNPLKKVKSDRFNLSTHAPLNQSCIEKSEQAKDKMKGLILLNKLNWNVSKGSENVFIASVDEEIETRRKGFIKILGNNEKPGQTTGPYQLEMIVMDGKVAVKIGDQVPIILSTCDAFSVPPFTKYSIRNLRNDDAFISFYVFLD